jgi:hypothetical protein
MAITDSSADVATSGLAGTEVSRTTRPWERTALACLVTLVTLGLAIDTRSHRESADLDTFFTRAHALGYAAGTGCAVLLLLVVRRRQSAGARGFRAIPLGFESAVAGIGVYVAGGVGDLIWHEAYGIEQELKILFSPTHLLLMAAMLMLAFGPIRGAWMTAEHDQQSTVTGMIRFWPVALAAGSLVSVLNIFLQYSSPFETSVFTVEIPALFSQFGSFLQIAATLGIYVHTVIFFGVALVLLRRWQLPIGAITLMLGIPAISMFVYFDWSFTRQIAALLIGAVLVDGLLAVLGAVRSVRLRYRFFGALAPVLFWTTYLLVTRNGAAITWSTEQWTGTIAWSGLLGLGLTVLLLPPRLTHRTWLD